MGNEITVRNESAIVEFESETPSARSIGAEIVSTQAANEVQMAMFSAKRFPRDEIMAYNRIIKDCRRKSLAEKAIYSYPRSGKNVTGPSIHLAKAIARGWGNIESGFKVLESNAKESTVMAFCWDLETNYRETKVFTVQHFRQTKSGGYALTDPRDIYEMVANQAARRERSCILSVVPGDVVDAAVGECEATIKKDGGAPIEDTIRKLIGVFKDELGVTPEMLEGYIGRDKETFTANDVVALRGVYTALRDGTASMDQYFKKNGTIIEDDKKEEPKSTHEKKQIKLDELK